MNYVDIINGKVTIIIVPACYPVFDGIIPAPLMTEIEREKLVQDAVNEKYIKGFWVEVNGRLGIPLLIIKAKKRRL